MSILRPLSPHLPIYKPQPTSTFSISHRISGAFLATIVFFFYLLCLKMGLICFTYENFYQFLFYSSKLILIAVEITALVLPYHLYNGVRHLLILTDFSGFFLKLGYIASFFILFALSYYYIFPTIEVGDLVRPLQVILQLSLYLLLFRSFTTKEEKEDRFLLIIIACFSVIATLFLKNLISLDGLLLITVPLFFSLYLFSLPSDILPLSFLLLYSLEKGLAQWAFYLLFQLITYYALCFFFEARPKQPIYPLILPFLYFYILGKVHYSADFLHEPARLLVLVSGACIIFLCFKKRGRVGFLFAFFIYFFSSTCLGMISISSGGGNISWPIPLFLFIFLHIFLFFGILLFKRNILPVKQTLVVSFWGVFLYLLPYFPNLEWLEGWIGGLDLLLLLLVPVLSILRRRK